MISVLLIPIDSCMESSFHLKHPHLPLLSGTDLNGAHEIPLDQADPYFVFVMGLYFQSSLLPQTLSSFL